MTTIKTDTKYNFEKAESDLFSWSAWDGTSGKMLKHKGSGCYIYQGCWLDERGKMADKIDAETREQVSTFWAELHELQIQKPPRLPEDDIDPEPEHGENGYCRKCHSYCYGDCEAN